MANADARPFEAERRAWLVALALFAALSPGCRTWQSFKERSNNIRTALFDTGYEDPRAAEKAASADELFTAGQYKKAQEVYRDLADNRLNSTDVAENARFMQAECRRMRGQYPQAVDTYHRLLMDFPTGAHRREACERMFGIADYWLDDFRDELQKRSGESGVLGWRPAWKSPFDKSRPWVGQEGRTIEALEHVWTHDMTGQVADKALFWCGYVNFIRGNFTDADHFFSTLCEMHKESPLRPQAMAYAIQAKNNATGGASYDARKCAEALQLVMVAEATVPELTQNQEMSDKLTRAKYAIRSQQAEKDFRTAEYYERTGHPGSAVFYYELVRRRYAGTKYSDVATERKDELLAMMRSGKPAVGNDPFAIASAKWKELMGRNSPPVAVEGEGPPDDRKLVPAGGIPASALPPSVGNPMQP